MDASTVPQLLTKGNEMEPDDENTEETNPEGTTEEAQEPTTPQPSWAEGNEANLREREGTPDEEVAPEAPDEG